MGLHLPTPPSGAFGEREGELRGVDVAVGREIGGAEDALDRHRRKELLRVRGGDQLEGSPNVFAQPDWRAISSILSGDDASRSEPTSRQPVSSPTSVASSR